MIERRDLNNANALDADRSSLARYSYPPSYEGKS
jgi:hypothetical protein